MAKRITGATLWFGAVWFAFELLWSIAGIPRLTGPIVGVLVAILVVRDPGGRLWGSHSQRQGPARRLTPVGAGIVRQP